MEAFTPMAKRITVVQGLEHPQCVSAGGHSTADSFLTGSNPAAGVKSPSLDQIAATAHGHKTRYPSLVLGNEGGLGGEGRSNTLSYNQFGRGILRQIIYVACMTQCSTPTRPCSRMNTND